VLLYQWATACVLTAQIFFAEARIATKGVRAGWLFVLPAALQLLALGMFHDSALTIARTSLVVCSLFGSLLFVVLPRRREGELG
jgi:hypothetical protein